MNERKQNKMNKKIRKLFKRNEVTAPLEYQIHFTLDLFMYINDAICTET